MHYIILFYEHGIIGAKTIGFHVGSKIMLYRPEEVYIINIDSNSIQHIKPENSLEFVRGTAEYTPIKNYNDMVDIRKGLVKQIFNISETKHT